MPSEFPHGINEKLVWLKEQFVWLKVQLQEIEQKQKAELNEVTKRETEVKKELRNARSINQLDTTSQETESDADSVRITRRKTMNAASRAKKLT